MCIRLNFDPWSWWVVLFTGFSWRREQMIAVRETFSIILFIHDGNKCPQRLLFKKTPTAIIHFYDVKVKSLHSNAVFYHKITCLG